jgi:hypothetical protein
VSQAQSTFKDTADVVAGTVALGVWAEIVPVVAGVLTIVWLVLRIYEWARVAIFRRDTRGI